MLWDLSKYYKHASHQKLMQKSHAIDFSTIIPRVVLKQDSGQRLVAAKDPVQMVDYPARAIAAGPSRAEQSSDKTPKMLHKAFQDAPKHGGGFGRRRPNECRDRRVR